MVADQLRAASMGTRVAGRQAGVERRGHPETAAGHRRPDAAGAVHPVGRGGRARGRGDPVSAPRDPRRRVGPPGEPLRPRPRTTSTRSDDEMCVLVQLETRAAVDALEEIAAVEGVDGVFIGPSDLAASLGYLGNNAHPEVREHHRAAPAAARRRSASRSAFWRRSRATRARIWTWASRSSRSAATSSCCAKAATHW